MTAFDELPVWPSHRCAKVVNRHAVVIIESHVPRGSMAFRAEHRERGWETFAHITSRAPQVADCRFRTRVFSANPQNDFLQCFPIALPPCDPRSSCAPSNKHDLQSWRSFPPLPRVDKYLPQTPLAKSRHRLRMPRMQLEVRDECRHVFSAQRDNVFRVRMLSLECEVE